MFRFDNEIEIAADPALVWEVTCDVMRWPAWNPTMSSARFINGDRLENGAVASLKQPFQPESTWEVTEFEPGRRFVWQSRRTGLTFSAMHRIDPAGSGTRNLLRVEASGVMALLLSPVLTVAMRRALVQENQALKALCESLSAD